MNIQGGLDYRLPPYRVETTLASLAETVDWSLAAYHVPQQWKATRGAGVTVAVLDTGIEAEHGDLAAAIDDARDFSRSRSGPRDRQGHGTHVAGTIAARRNEQGVVGIAPECRLLVGKVLGDDGAGSEQAVAAGIAWATERGADIISLSLGSRHPSRLIEEAAVRAARQGRFVICAAGNDGPADSVNYPAALESTIAVGAVDRHGRVARFSSRGSQVDIAAPGQDILSTWLGGSYAKLSGTSMAAPFVSGVVALMLAKHRATGGSTPLRNNDDLRAHLARCATDAGSPGHDAAYGWGLINPRALLAALDETPPAAAAPQELDLGICRLRLGVRDGDETGVLVLGPR